jgi:hypothetical protein
MKGKLGMLAIMTAMMGSGYAENSNSILPEDIDTTPKEKPVPKGCKRYYYNKNGICCKSESEVYFDAMKASKAREKYERWLSNYKTVV